jgi:hypothetical protein
MTLLCCMACPSVEGAVSIGVYGVFLALQSTSSSTSAHGAIAAVVMVAAVVDGEYLRRVFIQTDGDGFDAGGGSGGDCSRSCLLQSFAYEMRGVINTSIGVDLA